MPCQFLSTETESFDQFTVSLNIFVTQVSQQVFSASDHFEKTSSGVVVFLVETQVLVECCDFSSQYSDLHLWGSCVDSCVRYS